MYSLANEICFPLDACNHTPTDRGDCVVFKLIEIRLAAKLRHSVPLLVGVVFHGPLDFDSFPSALHHSGSLATPDQSGFLGRIVGIGHPDWGIWTILPFVSFNMYQVGLSQLFIFVVSISSSLVFDLLLRGRIRARFHTADAESLVTSFRRVLRGVCDGEVLLASQMNVAQESLKHLTSASKAGHFNIYFPKRNIIVLATLLSLPQRHLEHQNPRTMCSPYVCSPL
ncbi:unnamed protein product [Durusdinium trenchii]|uniref:Uncharacterized protein n=1 Tax=Durusdinium trenchii TaxID=1381693 RepID=A0ABP0N5S3_9DINO